MECSCCWTAGNAIPISTRRIKLHFTYLTRKQGSGTISPSDRWLRSFWLVDHDGNVKLDLKNPSTIVTPGIDDLLFANVGYTWFHWINTTYVAYWLCPQAATLSTILLTHKRSRNVNVVISNRFANKITVHSRSSTSPRLQMQMCKYKHRIQLFKYTEVRTKRLV